MMETPGCLRFLAFRWLHLNWDFEGREIAIDASILKLLLFIDFPMGLPWNAKSGMIEDHDEGAVFFNVIRRILYSMLRLRDILQTKDRGNVRKLPKF